MTTIENSYKPYDVVSDKNNNVGFINEVNPHFEYSVTWLVGGKYCKTAWYNSSELIVHCNLFVKIAQESCHPMGTSAELVNKLMWESK